MKRRPLIAIAATLLAATGIAAAQDFPKKQITIVVGFEAGGAADHAARVVAKKLTENLGTTVVVDNKPGAGGNIAHEQVARAAADGSVILLGSVGPLSIAPHLSKLRYDPEKDLAPLTMGMNFPNVLVVPPTLGVKTFAEFMALARKNPGKLNYGSTGVGSASHLAGELFNAMGGVEIVHIPFKGGAPAMNELLAGRISAYFATMSTAGPHIASGKLIPLATTGLQRAPFLPDLPTVSEAGLKGFSGHQLVCLRRTGQDARADARSLERGTGQGAEGARGGRRVDARRLAAGARHPRRTRAHHRRRVQDVGQGDRRSQDHRGVTGECVRACAGRRAAPEPRRR